jgi:transcriptional regulator with XRE-family HTH domain
MIAPQVVRWVQSLLADGRLSQREIARRAGLSRGSVANIARGRIARRRPVPERLDRPARPVRCPECGARVYPPCRACRVRRGKPR